MSKITLKLWNKINRFINSNNLISKRDKILLAVSGGPDSMLMLNYFHRCKKYDFIAFHLNHCIRKDSIKDENLVREYCNNYGIELYVERIDIASLALKNKENLENFARKKRYEMYLKYSAKYGCNLVATAHNMDENVETIILNIIRGKSLRGICGIPLKRAINKKISVVRPILCLRKSEIIEYLKENNINYIIDKTNLDVGYTRNWIRHKLLPLIESKYPSFIDHLNEISGKLNEFLKMK